MVLQNSPLQIFSTCSPFSTCSSRLVKKARPEGKLHHHWSLIRIVADLIVKPHSKNWPKENHGPILTNNCIKHTGSRESCCPSSEKTNSQSHRKEVIILQEHRQHYCAESCLLSCAELLWSRLFFFFFFLFSEAPKVCCPFLHYNGQQGNKEWLYDHGARKKQACSKRKWEVRRRAIKRTKRKEKAVEIWVKKDIPDNQ